MRTKLGRGAAWVALVGAVVIAVPTPVMAGSTPSSTPPVTEPPLVVIPSVPASRLGNDFQATDTLPAPPRPDALPENSGEGRRIVYSKTMQRVWTVEADGTVSRTYAVSGRRTWNQPTPNNLSATGEPEFRYYANPPAYYRVASRSAHTCNITKPHICWRFMVRFTKGPDQDNIGFHEIPTDTRTGRLLQTEAQLGAALSNGCVRQAAPDAQHVWNWAPIGTKVVVLP